jgi:transposase
MLALASVLEGSSREAAARAAGTDRRTLRDRVRRRNAEGLPGLHDRPRLGRSLRLGARGRAGGVGRGPDPDRDGVVRWRRTDVEALIKARFGVRLHERPVGEVPRRLGLARLSARPRRPEADEAARAAFRQASPSWRGRRGPGTPVADRSRSGSRTRPASAGRARSPASWRGAALGPEPRATTAATSGRACSARPARSGP